MVSTLKFGTRDIYVVNGIINDELTFRPSSFAARKRLGAFLLCLIALDLGMLFYTSGRSYMARASYYFGKYEPALAALALPQNPGTRKTIDLLPLSANIEEYVGNPFVDLAMHVNEAEAATPAPVNANITKTPEAQKTLTMRISTLHISAPIQETSADTKAINKALASGVIRWPGSDALGQGGTTIILGHSSAPLSYHGKYGSVFALLDKLEAGNIIFIETPDQTFYYRVHTQLIINQKEAPEDVLKGLDGEGIILVSCWPVGTNWQRIAIWADRIE